MALKLEDKKIVVTELRSIVEKSISAAAADYRGLTVSEMTELRKNARQSGVHLRVYRNTLARRAVDGTAFACLTETLVGPIVLLFSFDDPGAAARLLHDFIKGHENLTVRALVLDGELLGPDQLKAVASLPTLKEASTQLAVVIQAPVIKFVRTLREPYAQAVRVMGAVRDKKQ